MDVKDKLNRCLRDGLAIAEGMDSQTTGALLKDLDWIIDEIAQIRVQIANAERDAVPDDAPTKLKITQVPDCPALGHDITVYAHPKNRNHEQGRCVYVYATADRDVVLPYDAMSVVNRSRPLAPSTLAQKCSKLCPVRDDISHQTTFRARVTHVDQSRIVLQLVRN
jgi:hypothetical protein